MPETQNIEWKESWRDEYLKWICGFANAKGGKLYIGKDDYGNIVGLKEYKKLMDDIPNKIQNNLGIVCDVNLYTDDNLHYLEIDVKPYDIAISYKGKYHYRSGSTKQELKGKALNDFLLKKSGKTWDDVIEARASLEDIDQQALEVFKKAAIKSKRLPSIQDEDDFLIILDNLLLLENQQPKRACVLLFSNNPNRYYINANIKIGRFGNTDDELLYQEVIESNIFELADKTIDVLDKKFLISPITYQGLNRVEKWEFPYKAVREAIINAIAHRDYSGAPTQISVYDDKLIIWNEGQLPEGLKIEDLKKKHSSRPFNPLIASVFFKGGLIEAWGRGTINILNECLKAGLPEPIFEANSGGFSVTLFKDKYTEENLSKSGLNERQIKAILHVKKNDFITNSIYQSLCNTSDRTASRDLEQLRLLNIFKKVGEKKGTKYVLIFGG